MCSGPFDPHPGQPLWISKDRHMEDRSSMAMFFSPLTSGTISALCLHLSLFKHFILVWLILTQVLAFISPDAFHFHNLYVILGQKPFWVNPDEDRIFSPLGILLMYAFAVNLLANNGFFLAEDASSGANPVCPNCRLYMLSTFSPVLTKPFSGRPLVFS